MALPNRQDQELFYSTPEHGVIAFFGAAESYGAADGQFIGLQSLSEAVMVRMLSNFTCPKPHSCKISRVQSFVVSCYTLARMCQHLRGWGKPCRKMFHRVYIGKIPVFKG